jgi:hypothetical protein
MVLLREADAGDHDGSGLSLLQQMQVAHHQVKNRKANASTAIVVLHVKSLLRSNRGKLREVFLKLDKDGGGSVDFEEFRRGLMNLGIELQDEEARGVFSTIDESGDGEVSIREFMTTMAKPLKPLKIIFNDFFEGIRRIGVYIDRRHAIKVYEHCRVKDGVIHPVKLEKLINDPMTLQSLSPQHSESMHAKGKAGLPPPVQTKSFRFSNTVLSNLQEQQKQAEEEHNRDLLHRTIRRVELKYVTAAFRKWAFVACADTYLLKRKSKNKSVLKPGQVKEVIAEDKPTADDLKTEADFDEEAESFTDNFAAGRNRKMGDKLRKEKERKRRKLLEQVQYQIKTIPRPHWNSSSVWPYRYKNMKVEEIPPLATMFKQTSYWSKNCSPRPKRAAAHKVFQPLGQSKVSSPRRPEVGSPRPSPNRNGRNHRPNPYNQFDKDMAKKAEARSKKIDAVRSPRKSFVSRKEVAMTMKAVSPKAWKAPRRPRGHSMFLVVHSPSPDVVDLDNPKDRIEKFDQELSTSNMHYGKLLRFVNNSTPVTYPKINYDVDGNSSFPHMEKIISKFSKSQMLATKRLAEMKARRKELKQAESERRLKRMGADARSAIRDLYGIAADTV